MGLNQVLSVPGSLTVTPTTLTTDLKQFADNLVKTITAQYAEADRASAFTPAAGVEFYIMVDMDLNAKVTNVAGGDLLGLEGFIVTSNDAGLGTVTTNLPSFTAIAVDTGTITFNSADGHTGHDPADPKVGEFTSSVALTMDSVGNITAAVTIAGSELSVSAPDNVDKAQLVMDGLVPGAADAVNEGTTDILSASLTAAELTTHFADEIAAIKALYDGKQLISSFSIQIDAIPENANSTIAKYARNEVASGNFLTPFKQNAKIVAATPHQLQITLTDATGASVNMYQADSGASKPIYGVLQHVAPNP